MNALPVPMSLIVLGVTALVSLIAFGSPHRLVRFAISPYEVARYGRWYQLLSSGFFHTGFGHLFMNMFTLYFFGPPMERLLGWAGFLILYLGSMLGGSLMTFWFHRRDPGYRALGASGAISGVLFGFILFRPLAPIYVFLIPIGIPAALFAVLYVLVSVYGMKSRYGRIGHEAHLGGALTGVILTIMLEPRALGIFLSHFR